MDDVLRVSTADDRFSRLELIAWWDQARLDASKVLVIGAGALGNEILKNLALLGVGNVLVVDLDTVENSNLSRSVLFREADCGKPKAQVAVEAAQQIYPDMRTQALRGNVVHDLGVGVFRWADVIIGGLDNREARVAINRAAARAGRAWIDGAIERLDGVARVFDPATGPCYECTMGENDWKMLEARRSCALLSRQEMETGKVPTTPTTASVIAGIQSQEAVKLLHGQPVMFGQGFVFEGVQHQSYLVTYTRRDDCESHEKSEPIEVLAWRSDATTVGALLERAREDLGDEAILEFNQDLIESLTCPKCHVEQTLVMALGKVTPAQAVCPTCGSDRAPRIFHTAGEDKRFSDYTLSRLGIPPWEVIGARNGINQRFYEMQGDRDAVLGNLAK